MIVGLTGGIGSGKTTVAQIFRGLQVEVIDSDQITRDLVEKGKPAYQKIVAHFGETILQPDANINRPKLRSIIFESPEERKWLENLLHPLAKTEILNLRDNINPGKYRVVEIPLLFEAEFQNAVDRILVIDCDEAIQIDRVTRRDALPKNILQAILKSQTEREVRLTKAHDVIINEGSKEELKAKVNNLHNQYISLVKKHHNELSK